MMTDDDAIVAAVRKAWPNDVTEGPDGFGWVNLDGERFAHPAFEDAALDLAHAADLRAKEARSYLAGEIVSL